eukprot:CAMPEP_0180796466 /NCGR_PEP_ID=MMETSP1038_2-20121128/56805_1 /TAXON_ID=632150 /ORGANISM="Azadinium spinosum, Strain 3D9" /LENGTH=47 /DNA_ID= /DNA_START= /DNA_END= /DNA_ORIENTATION=
MRALVPSTKLLTSAVSTSPVMPSLSKTMVTITGITTKGACDGSHLPA